jgi:transcriptional regulator with XRE-family HTH domain
MDMKKLRVDALRRVIGSVSQKDFAERHDLDASYLSQILNGHRVLGEKAALTLEQKIGLAPGVLVNPLGYGSNVIEAEFVQLGASPRPAPSIIKSLSEISSPRAISAIEKIAKAAAKGGLQDADLILLEGIAGLLEKAHLGKR